jgi:RNA polymerase sigma factor for flagellar operon FliA
MRARRRLRYPSNKPLCLRARAAPTESAAPFLPSSSATLPPWPPTNNSADLEQTFVASLPRIDRIIAAQARRHALAPADAEDFASWAKERLMDGDYAILRKFGGRSLLPTYLTTVLVNLCRDFRNRRWGRWRPSAAALRLGPVAMRLEELLYRDGMGLREATTILCETGADAARISRIAWQLPTRERVKEVSLDAAVRSGLEPRIDSTVRTDREAALRQMEATVQSAIEELPAEDAEIVRRRFWHDQSIADIARALRLDQKTLYRRVDGVKAQLRRTLETRGIDRGAAAELIDGVMD